MFGIQPGAKVNSLRIKRRTVKHPFPLLLNVFWVVFLFSVQSALAQDTTQVAETAMGWNQGSISNSVVTADLLRYDADGNSTSKGKLTLYRQYPNLIRVEILDDSGQSVYGFDGTKVWNVNSKSLSVSDARNILAWLRFWPERLFAVKDAGGTYREVGSTIEDYQTTNPGNKAVKYPVRPEYKQVEVIDNITFQATSAENLTDSRRISYFVDKDTSLIHHTRWLEPEDPSKDPSDLNQAWVDSRIDFSDWQTINGIQWPFTVVHQWGGKVDFVLKLSNVQLSQTLASSTFQVPLSSN